MGDLGENLKRFRRQKDWTVRELSAYSGVSVGYIGGIETGAKQNVGLGKLRQLAEALGVSVADLLGR